MKLIKTLKRKVKRGQTALEYALVVAGISLVAMAAWNIVAPSIREGITGTIGKKIQDNLTKGNATVPR